MHPFPLDMIISLVEPGVSELGLEGAMLTWAMVQSWGCLSSGDTLVG